MPMTYRTEGGHLFRNPCSWRAGTSFFLGAVLACVLSACATKYPASESANGLTYPLPECSPAIVERAKVAVTGETVAAVQPDQVCVTAIAKPTLQAETEEERRSRLERQAFSPNEQQLRTVLEQPFLKGAGDPAFGLALSGGGSKAAAFTVGVMAGLADHGLLDTADYISSVSGGGYAAYFYYAHRLFPLLRQGGRQIASTTDLYRDCIGIPPDDYITAETKQAMQRVNHCARLGLFSESAKPEHRAEDIRYQAFLKCNQDVLRPGVCDTRTNYGLDLSLSRASMLGSVTLLPLSNVSNTLFDWGYSTSPSGLTYREGIGYGYGATVAHTSILPQKPGQLHSLCRRGSHSGAIYDCRPNLFDPDPVPLTFDDLRSGLRALNREPGGRIPFWIINATAPEYRSVFGWLGKSRDDVTNSDMFEMTAVAHGSGRYGYVSAPVSIYDMTVLDAVAASAAFFDSNQLVYSGRFAKAAIGLGAHFFNFDWGYDIPNYNVSSTRRHVHRALPVPFYYADGLLAGIGSSPEMHERTRSVFIRLIDGGNSENLGVYSLLKRNTRNILISDAAQDKDGLFGDVCGLQRRLKNAPEGMPRFLYVPGLANFEEHCGKEAASPGYDLHAWSSEQPILFGCIRQHAVTSAEHESCQGLGLDETRLFIVKPAIDMKHFVGTQLAKEDGKAKLARCQIRGSDVPQDASLLNCESAAFLVINDNVEPRKGCPIFPQHGTAPMTANSSMVMFVAYRELAREYVSRNAQLLKDVISGTEQGRHAFETAARAQYEHPMQPGHNGCASLLQTRLAQH